MDQKPSKDFANQIKRLRARMGLTQVNLAERLGVSFPTVNRWENAKSKPSQLSWNRLLELWDKAVSAIESVKYVKDTLTIFVNPRSISKMRGLNNSNIKRLKEQFHFQSIAVVPDSSLAAEEMNVESA